MEGPCPPKPSDAWLQPLKSVGPSRSRFYPQRPSSEMTSVLRAGPPARTCPVHLQAPSAPGFACSCHRIVQTPLLTDVVSFRRKGPFTPNPPTTPVSPPHPAGRPLRAAASSQGPGTSLPMAVTAQQHKLRSSRPPVLGPLRRSSAQAGHLPTETGFPVYSCITGDYSHRPGSSLHSPTPRERAVATDLWIQGREPWRLGRPSVRVEHAWNRGTHSGPW